MFKYRFIAVIGMTEFSTRAMHELIKSNTGKRVSYDAADKIGEILETFAGDTAEEAIVIAQEEGREGGRAEDVKEALH